MKIKDAEKIVKTMWKKANLYHIKFKWGRMKRGFGYYSFNRGDEEIVMSKQITLLNSKKLFINSLLHEIAHAMVGPTNGHNTIWKRMAERIGCDGERCYSGVVKIPKGKHKYRCPKCGFVYNMYRVLSGKRSCGKCCDKYSKGKYTAKFALVKVK